MRFVLPSCVRTPGSAAPAPAGCWQQQDPERGHRAGAQGAESWWPRGHTQTSEPPRSWLSTETDSAGKEGNSVLRVCCLALRQHGRGYWWVSWLQINFVCSHPPGFSTSLQDGSSDLKPCCLLDETVPVNLIKVNQTKKLPVRQMCSADQRQH